MTATKKITKELHCAVRENKLKLVKYNFRNSEITDSDEYFSRPEIALKVYNIIDFCQIILFKQNLN